MFLQTFMDTKVADGIKYDTLNQLCWNAHCVLGIPVRTIAAWLLEHREYAVKLIVKYASW
jgi:hypothetical protein